MWTSRSTASSTARRRQDLRPPATPISCRYFKRVQAHTGDKIAVQGALKPAFALVAATGQASGLNTDLRTLVERLLEPTESITIFAPPADEADQALRASQLPAAWLA